MVSAEIWQQTEEDINSIPRIEVVGSYIKEIVIEKRLIVPGDLEANPPIYKIKIMILDDIGGRHQVTNIKGLCKGKLEVRV